MKAYRNPETLHQPIALYTHQIEVSGTPRWLVLSGQIGMEKEGALPDGAVTRTAHIM